MDAAPKPFDPIAASEHLKTGFIDYITTTFHITDPVYKAALNSELRKDAFLTKGPYLDISGSYRTGRNLRALMENKLVSCGFDSLEPVEEKDRELKLDRPLYLHQEQALLKADAGNNLIITTGTGSGKTECFLLPILQTLLQEEENGPLSDGLRAILIYPMNALANDQMKRMRKIMKGHKSITFGIYTGNTKQSESAARSAFRKSYGAKTPILENEMLSRDRMRETPPHILITNYSMLEYMMLRPKDDIVFSGAKLRYIVLDEAHVYKGATGMETAMLMRRLRARISTSNSVQFILTSATLGGEDANREITEFGRQLCGVDFLESNIIRSQDATPVMTVRRPYSPELFHKLAQNTEPVSKVLEEFGISDPAPDADDNEKLYALMLTSQLFAVLREESSRHMEIGALSRAMGIPQQELLDLVAVCTRAEKGKTALLKARIHYFVRALEGAYVTLGKNPTLSLTRHERTKDDRTIFEVAVCQDCGRLALVGHCDKEGYLRQVSRKTDHDPKECEYYTLWDQMEEAIVFEEDHEEDEAGTDEFDYVVCACCGKLGAKADLIFGNICDCPHPEYVHVKKVMRTKTRQEAKCPACGQGAFRAFYLGNEAATSVLGTELFEQLPTQTVTPNPSQEQSVAKTRFRFSKPKPTYTVEEKMPQFLCFSDSRSEAAVFPVHMEREYQRYLRNRGIWRVVTECIDEGISSISVRAFVDRLIRIFNAEGSFDRWDADHDKLDANTLYGECKKNAWMAVVSELYNSRNSRSLSSVGLLHFEYAGEQYIEEKEAFLNYLQEANMDPQEAEALMQQIFLDGIYNSGALNAKKAYSFSPEERESIFHSEAQKQLVKITAPNESKYANGWAPRKRKSGTFYPNTRHRRIIAATNWDEEDANEFLHAIWERCLEPHKNEFIFDICDFKINFNEISKRKTWRCKKCGSVTAYNVQNRCAILQCGGTLEAVEPKLLQTDNHYVKRFSGERMKPLQMREHTAQLSRNAQTQYQQAFVEQKINALSCSTTFEMGVDVGGLETVYMRDIPPGPANYVQRAGRAGRAAHTAAYVLTYAKLSSHDFTFYKDPETVICGKIKAPVFALENEKVLSRHIFAVALAEFLAANEDVYGGDSRYYLLNDGGYERLKQFLETPSQRLSSLLRQSVPGAMHRRLGILDGSWRDRLIGENGVLEKAVADYRTELNQLENELKLAEKAKNYGLASKLEWEIRRFRAGPDDEVKKKSLIEFLTRSNVLPKYGFPVDTVELQIGATSSDESSDLQLSRDLQMAIAEYAPGAQIIADGKMYTSRYIRKAGFRSKNDTGWEYGYYAKCTNCQEMNFSKDMMVRKSGSNCISCDQKIKGGSWHKTLEPRMGFVTEDAEGKPVPVRKPERDYKTDDCYVGSSSRTVLQTHEFAIGAERVLLQSSMNDSLAVVGQGKHVVCPFCGYATGVDNPVLPDKHKNARGFECTYQSNGTPNMPVYLSHVFKTDVAAITFRTPAAVDYATMLSVMYALLEGLSKELDIERTDIKGCLHKIKWEGSGLPIHSIILYDAVAGGAGHVRRIVTEDGKVFERVLRRAYEIVSTCKCQPSCYCCIRNYYNQKKHDDLDRNKAAAFLRLRLGSCIIVEPEVSAEAQTDVLTVTGGDAAKNYRSWASVYESNCFDGSGAPLDKLEIDKSDCIILPDAMLGDQHLEPYLAWTDKKIMLFDEVTSQTRQMLAGLGWHADTMDTDPVQLAQRMKGINEYGNYDSRLTIQGSSERF